MVADALSITGQAVFRYTYGILSLYLKTLLIYKGCLSDGEVRVGLLML